MYRLRSESPEKNARRASASLCAGALNRNVEPSRRITSTAAADSRLGVLTGKRLLSLESLSTGRGGLEHHLQRVRSGRVGKGVVRRHRLSEREAMSRERRRVEPPLGDELQQARRRGRVDETRRDRDAANPEPLEVQRRGMPVNADVGDVA